MSRTHGFIMSGLSNIRSESWEPDSTSVFDLTRAAQTVVHGLGGSASRGSWSDVQIPAHNAGITTHGFLPTSR